MQAQEARRDIGAEIEAKAAELSLTAEWRFVPFSQSRNKAEKSPSLNWVYTLKRDGREVLTGDYMQGCGHCPAAKASMKELGGHNSLMRDRALRAECETRKTWRPALGAAVGKIIPAPPLADLLHCLALDADALEYEGFEGWAACFGYDTDSRKAEAIYRECLGIALKLRIAIGDVELAALRELCNEY